MLSVKQEAVIINFKVISLTRLEIKPESTAHETEALTTRLSSLFNWYCFVLVALSFYVHIVVILQAFAGLKKWDPIIELTQGSSCTVDPPLVVGVMKFA